MGANGTLGSVLSELYQTEDLTRLTESEIDLTQLETIQPVIERLRPQLLINAAAYNNVDGAETSEPLAMKINGQAVRELAQAATKQKALFVHYSTDYVFDGTSGRSYREGDPPNPQSAYARSKLRGEEFTRQFALRHLIIRTSRLYGQPGAAASSKPSFVSKMLELSRSRDRIEVLDSERSSPTYARDLARASQDLIRSGATGTFHRTNAGDCTWYELAKEIFALTGWRGTLVPADPTQTVRAASRPASSVLATTKLAPMRDWRAALGEFLKVIHAIP